MRPDGTIELPAPTVPTPESIEPVVDAYAASIRPAEVPRTWDELPEQMREAYRRAVRQQVTDILTLAHDKGWVGPGEAPF